VLVVAALVAGVIVYTSNSPDSPDRRRSDDHYLAADRVVRPRITKQMERYEDASEALAHAYEAKKVSAAEWLQTSNDHLPIMVSALSYLDYHLIGATEREAIDLRKFVLLSHDELEALFDLREALTDMDPIRETYAWKHWFRVRDRQFHFLGEYYYRRDRNLVEYGSIQPSIPLKSLA
jgi:hypothetical protein